MASRSFQMNRVLRAVGLAVLQTSGLLCFIGCIAVTEMGLRVLLALGIALSYFCLGALAEAYKDVSTL